MVQFALKKHSESEPDTKNQSVRPNAFLAFEYQDRGIKKNFNLTKKRTVIGRSLECDLVLKDKSVSREHAEVVFLKDKVIITDLGSHNGIKVNGNLKNQLSVEVGDVIRIGIFELKIKDTSLPSAEFESNFSNIGRSFLIIGLIGALVLFLYSPEEQSATIQSSGYEVDSFGDDGFSNQLEKKQLYKDKKLAKKIEVILQRGLREQREGNYFRAMSEFNHVLDLNPADTQANFYLRKAKEQLNRDVQSFEVYAEREMESLYYRRAAFTLCAIIRLLHHYPNDKRYISAQQKIKNIEGILGMEENEIKCLEK